MDLQRSPVASIESESPRGWRRWLRPPRLYAVLAAAALAIFGLTRLGGGGEAAPAFETVPAERGDVVSKVSATGTLSALVTVEVGSQVSGRIQSLFADFNSVVSKGDRIAKIDPSLFEAAVAQARANVAAARGNVQRLQVQAEEAARQARRTSQLFEQRLVSENDRDNAVSNRRAAEAAVAQAEGQLAQSRAALQQAQTNLRYTDILAPTDGIVISRAVNVGQTVAASLQAPVIFTIAQDLRKMEVHTNVAESDIGRLAAGLDASFTVDAWPGQPFRGRIREIRNAPQIVQNVVTYDAVIDVDNSDLRLKPGMTATVTVVVDERQNVLRVPSAALRFRPDVLGGGAGADGGGAAASPPSRGDASARRPRGDAAGASARAVWVLVDGKPARRAVATGLTDGTNTEITGGELREGEPVIVGLAGSGAGAGARGSGGGGGRRPQFRIL